MFRVGQRRKKGLNVPEGLIAYWQMGSESGINPVNEPVSGYDAVRQVCQSGAGAGVSYITNHKGESNSAIRNPNDGAFYGYVWKGGIPQNVWRSGFSYCFWFYREVHLGAYSHNSISDNSFTDDIFLFRSDDDSHMSLLTPDWSKSKIFYNNTWYFLSVRYNGSNLVSYNVNSDKYSKTETINEGDIGNGCIIGGHRYYSNYRNLPRYRMCDVRVFNRYLTDSELEHVKNNL